MSDKFFTNENNVKKCFISQDDLAMKLNFFQTAAKRKQNHSKPLDRSHYAKSLHGSFLLVMVFQ